ncbi:MAG: serine/threonine protein kinase [Myxococcales bacterium]|nr:serine/threonine protein kinase [Myxococcales bacterium]
MSSSNPPKILDRKYVLGEILGGGVATVVYRGKRLSDGETVAIKVLEAGQGDHPVLQGRFLREIEASRLLSHPCIVKVFDTGTDPFGTKYIVMEYLKGESLRTKLDREKYLTVRDTLSLAIQLANALVEAHGFGLIHRDLKPDNVFWTETQQLKLLDFGLVRSITTAGRRLTISGSTVGTARYMSPEQMEGVEVDERTDLYSLGLIMYEALLGFHPLGEMSFVDLLMNHQNRREFPPVATACKNRWIPSELAGLVDSLVKTDRALRPASARAILARLVTLDTF